MTPKGEPGFWMSELCAKEVLSRLGDKAAVLIEVIQAKGSVPREVGAWMVATPSETFNTIGGGHLEYEAITLARQMISDPDSTKDGRLEKTFPLGPSLGQCCGGVVTLGFRPIAKGAERQEIFSQLHQSEQSDVTSIAIFGGGHVAHAIVKALMPLPFRIHWVDSREHVFPALKDPKITTEQCDDITAAIPGLARETMILVMSFTHAEDLDLIRAALLRKKSDPGCFPWIGLIGSKTKWARFRHRLSERLISDDLLNQVTCPIGIAGITGKSPSIIAASVAAQLLAVRQTV